MPCFIKSKPRIHPRRTCGGVASRSPRHGGGFRRSEFLGRLEGFGCLCKRVKAMLAELSPLVLDVLGASTCTKQLLSDSLSGAHALCLRSCSSRAGPSRRFGTVLSFSLRMQVLRWRDFPLRSHDLSRTVTICRNGDQVCKQIAWSRRSIVFYPSWKATL